VYLFLKNHIFSIVLYIYYYLITLLKIKVIKIFLKLDLDFRTNLQVVKPLTMFHLTHLIDVKAHK